jgi:hypothetical protein
MLALTTEVHLVALHTGVVKESLHIEYKASDAIDKKSDQKSWKWREISPLSQMQMEASHLRHEGKQKS